jgi:hypothetical protein
MDMFEQIAKRKKKGKGETYLKYKQGSKTIACQVCSRKTG